MFSGNPSEHSSLEIEMSKNDHEQSRARVYVLKLFYVFLIL